MAKKSVIQTDQAREFSETMDECSRRKYAALLQLSGYSKKSNEIPRREVARAVQIRKELGL